MDNYRNGNGGGDIPLVRKTPSYLKFIEQATNQHHLNDLVGEEEVDVVGNADDEQPIYNMAPP